MMSDVLTVAASVLGLYAAVYILGYGAGSLWAFFKTSADID